MFFSISIWSCSCPQKAHFVDGYENFIKPDPGDDLSDWEALYIFNDKLDPLDKELFLLDALQKTELFDDDQVVAELEKIKNNPKYKDQFKKKKVEDKKPEDKKKEDK